MYNLKNKRYKRGEKFSTAFKDTLMKHWDYDKNIVSPDKITCGTDGVKVWLNCKNGHSFDTTPSNLKMDRWCPYCSGKKVCFENSFGYNNRERLKNWSNENSKTPFEVTRRSDYKAKFICDCGNEFYSQVKDVTIGKWCAKCSNRPKKDNQYIDNEIRERNFIRTGNYINARTNLEFLCKKCNKHFKSMPDNVINKNTGCPHCKISKGEEAVKNYLDIKNIKFKREVKFDDLIGINGGKLRFDFYVDYNGKKIVIEYDGIFHYENMYSEKLLKDTKENDKIKNEYCKNNNILMIRIPHWEFENIDKMLNKVFY